MQRGCFQSLYNCSPRRKWRENNAFDVFDDLLMKNESGAFAG